MNNDIWFDLCLGNVEVDDDGTHHYKAEFTRLSQLSASNITSIAKYREMLHKLLDKAIDHIEAAQQPRVPDVLRSGHCEHVPDGQYCPYCKEA